MIKVYCDKCGNEVEEYCSYTLRVQCPEINDWDDPYLYIAKNYNLCRDCMKKVYDFITVSTGTVCSKKENSL